MTININTNQERQIGKTTAMIGKFIFKDTGTAIFVTKNVETAVRLRRKIPFKNLKLESNVLSISQFNEKILREDIDEKVEAIYFDEICNEKVLIVLNNLLNDEVYSKQIKLFESSSSLGCN